MAESTSHANLHRLALAITLAAAGVASAANKHVVLIVADDLGWADIAANNPDTFYETPHLDRLAASGLRFTDGYATAPVCSPSRYSLVTGRYPVRAHVTEWFSGRREATFRHAPFGNNLPLAEVTLAEALKEHGYRTFFAGKWHLGEEPSHWPEAQGYDENHGGYKRGMPNGGTYFSPYQNPRLADGPPGEHLPWRLARETCDFLERGARAGEGARMFVHLSFYEVHTPLSAPEDLVEKYREKASRLGLDPAGKFDEAEQVWPVDRKRRRRTLQSHSTYAAMVESMDTAVGIVMDKLEQLGIADETVVCFTSDNGGLSTSEGSPTSNLPLKGGKGWLDEGGIRVPLLLRAEGVTQPGAVTAVPATGADLYPTVLDLLGLPLRPEQHLDGQSLVPAIAADEPAPRPLFWHYPHYSNQGGYPGAAVRLGDWKLIQRYEDGALELYRVGDDAAEDDEVLDQYPNEAERLRGELHAFLRSTEARFLRPKDGATPWRPEWRR